jgi:hypothetical protein
MASIDFLLMSIAEDSSIMALGWDSSVQLSALRPIVQPGPAGQDHLRQCVYIAASWRSVWILKKDAKARDYCVKVDFVSAADASVCFEM